METNQQPASDTGTNGSWDSQPPHAPHLHGSKPVAPKKPILLIVIVVAILALLGGGVYWLAAGHKSSPKAAPKTTTQQSTQPATQDTSTPKTYKSTTLNIEFTYPADWTMRQNADKSEITLTSPKVTYKKKDGTSTDGVFNLKMRNGIIPDAMKTTIQNAVALQDSTVIAYKQPTDQQRQYTNVSFAGNGTNMNFFMVTGNTAYKTGETFGSGVDLEGAVYLFAGGFGADTNDSLAFDAVSKDTFLNGATYKQALGVVESLKIY